MVARSIALSVCAIACACSARQPANTVHPGASSAPRPSSTATISKPPARREKWERFDEVASWQPVNLRSFVSRDHFGGGWLARVRVSADARAAYSALVPGRELSPGTVVAAFHSHPKDGSAGPVLAMVKGARDWEYLALDAQGYVEERGSLPLCARCHAEAVADELFGLPKPPGDTPAEP